MKKILLIGFMVFAIAAISFAQMGIGPFPTGSNIKVVKCLIPTEGDYIANIATTANDTTSAYTPPAGWSEAWLMCKPYYPGGVDSIDCQLTVDVKTANQVNVKGAGTGWYHLTDSLTLITADTLYGGYVKLNSCPPNITQMRVVLNGVTGNGPTLATYETWLIFRK